MQTLKSHPICFDRPTGRVSVDLGSGRLRARDVRTPMLTVERLQARLDDAAVLQDLFEATSLDEAGKALEGVTVDIDTVQLRIPQETLCRGLQQMMPERHPELSLSAPDGFRLAGRVEGWVTVPFEIAGKLGATTTGQLLADIQQATIFGMLPAMLPACASIGAKLARKHVGHTRDGGRFAIDPASRAPSGTRFFLTDVHVEGTDLIVSGHGAWTDGRGQRGDKTPLPRE